MLEKYIFSLITFTTQLPKKGFINKLEGFTLPIQIKKLVSDHKKLIITKYAVNNFKIRSKQFMQNFLLVFIFYQVIVKVSHLARLKCQLSAL